MEGKGWVSVQLGTKNRDGGDDSNVWFGGGSGRAMPLVG
jgi:hypothetical protein